MKPQAILRAIAILWSRDKATGNAVKDILADYDWSSDGADYLVHWARDRGNEEALAIGQALQRMSDEQRSAASRGFSVNEED